VLGHEIEKGLLPNDGEIIGATIKNICFENAYTYFGLDVPRSAKPVAINKSSAECTVR